MTSIRTFNPMNNLTRRGFISTAAIGAAALPLVGHAAVPGAPRPAVLRGSCAHDENSVRFYSPAVREPLSITIVADTHLFRDDERGALYRPYSARMAKAYNATKHFKTGAATTPEQAFVKVLAAAREAKSDMFAMLGDI